MSDRPSNWVFLGDSLTEGIGSSRISYVAELANQLRTQGIGRAVHELRLRKVDPDGFNRFVRFNLAGHLNADQREAPRTLWLWNLACEGRTLDTDLEWLPLLHNLQPQLIVVHRGGLESVLRPAMLGENCWPWWVPQAWRGYAAMDPRCYFSTTAWWRKAKQVTLDAAKQMIRLRLLQRRHGMPLISPESLLPQYRTLLGRLRAMSAHVLVLGLLPIDARLFPGSPEHFEQVNVGLREMAAAEGAEFLDWASRISTTLDRASLFYRDGFHPNLAGARVLADILGQHLAPLTAQ
jgi:lysophospholipase L1-like esterase